MKMPYDGSRTALMRPEQRSSFFALGAAPGPEALAAEAARLAYLRFDESAEEAARLSADLALAGFAPPTLFNHAGTHSQAYGTLRGDGLALLAFRGTQPDKIIDIGIDLKALLRPAPFGPGRVHGGFREAALALLPQVRSWLDGPAARRKRLLLCGHSLGGSIATLLARTLAADEVLTIASPRVGDAAYVEDLAAHGPPITRIVNHRDAVARVPPSTLGYRHVGRTLWIDADGTAHSDADPADSDADLPLFEVPGLLAALLPLSDKLPRALTDHAPFNYLRAFWPSA